MPARLAVVNVIAERRGTRNGSRRHNSTNSGAATSAPTMRPMRRTGKIISRKLIVSASTTRKSKKLTLICWMLILNCDSTINASIMISDSAAASAGRRNSASQTPLRKHQVSSAVRARTRYVRSSRWSRALQCAVRRPPQLSAN